MKTSSFVLWIIWGVLLGAFLGDAVSFGLPLSWVRSQSAFQALLAWLGFFLIFFPAWFVYVFPQCPKLAAARRFVLGAAVVFVLPIAGLLYAASAG